MPTYIVRRAFHLPTGEHITREDEADIATLLTPAEISDHIARGNLWASEDATFAPDPSASPQLAVPGASGFAFTRASTRTHPRMPFLELAANAPAVERVVEAVAKNPRYLGWGDGLKYLGMHPDGSHVYSGTHGGQAGLHKSVDGITPPTLWVAGASGTYIMETGTILEVGGNPATIRRRAWNDINTLSAVLLTFEAGYPGGQGVSGRQVGYFSGNCFTASGNSAWIGAYSNEPRFSHEIYRTDDDGATWAKVFNFTENAGQNTHIHGIYFDPAKRRLWCIVGDGPSNPGTGIYYSDNPFAALGVMTFTKLNSRQPISAFRWRDRIIFGGDETPQWVSSCKADFSAVADADYQQHNIDRWWTGQTPPLEGAGPLYDLGVIDGWIIGPGSQSHDENPVFNQLWVCREPSEWFAVASTNTDGFGQPGALVGGGMILKPHGSGISAGNFLVIDGFEMVERVAVRTDLAAVGAPANTRPLVDTDWEFVVGEGAYAHQSGPVGETAMRIGRPQMLAARYLTVTPGQEIEVMFDISDPLALGQADVNINVVVNAMFYNASGVATTNAQRSFAANQLVGRGWYRSRHRFTVPNDGVSVRAQCSLQVTGGTFVFNTSTSYLLAANIQLMSRPQTELDSHNRAAETLTFTPDLRSALYTVVDRYYPAWESELILDIRTLLRLVDAAKPTNYLELQYVPGQLDGNNRARLGVFHLIQYVNGVAQATVVGPEVRTYGAWGPRHWTRSNGEIRAVWLRHDPLAFAFRVQSDGEAVAIIWDRKTTTAVELVAPKPFRSSNVQVVAPPSDGAHALQVLPTFVETGSAAMRNLLLSGRL